MKKICILGGGPAGLAAAYGLSATKALRAEYDVTVYQVGWKLGGKCSTGRKQPGDHVEQNCAHYLFGCYNNTFAMVRDIYAKLAASGRTEFGDFDDVLLPRNLIALKQQFKGEWHTWMMEFPSNSVPPGDQGGEYLKASQYLETAMEWILEGIFGWKFINKLNNYEYRNRKLHQPSLWQAEMHILERFLHVCFGWLTRLIHAIVKRRHRKRLWLDRVISWCLKRLRSFVWWLDKNKVEDNLARQRKWSMFDYGCSIIIGVLDDRVLEPGGFEGIDQYDFREWLVRHGATKYATESPFVTLWYQNSLAYNGGDTDCPSMSAAVSLLGQMYAANNYKGSVAFSLRQEIGDSFISPLYLALKARGVKVNFFHRVRNLETNKDHTRLERIIIEQQVLLANSQPDSYQPLIDVKGYPCWPDAPDASQFEESDRVRFEQGTYNLESFYTTWKSQHPELVLERGKHFDSVIYAMPHSTIPFYCSDIYQNKPAWKNLVDKNPMVESQSLRLWFRPDLKGIGWPYPPPILSGYEVPYCTWEDDGQLVDGETWDADNTPGSIACVFGPLQAPVFPPGPDDHEYVLTQKTTVDIQAEHFEQKLATGIWPDVGGDEFPDGIDPAKLILKSRRANSGPLERYMMTWPGGLQHRLRTDESGVEGLLFAGDWVRNGVDAGSIESATIAGLQASRAICGSPATILGENISYD